jgi:hypothetical protein
MTDRYRAADEPSLDAKPGATPAPDLLPTNGSSSRAAKEPVIRQLDTILENLASYAAPVLREIAARAAELAAKAGQAAGPVAHKAAEKTEEVGDRLATKGREVAADLRRDAAATGPIAPKHAEQGPAAEEAGLPPR